MDGIVCPMAQRQVKNARAFGVPMPEKMQRAWLEYRRRMSGRVDTNEYVRAGVLWMMGLSPSELEAWLSVHAEWQMSADPEAPATTGGLAKKDRRVAAKR